MFGWTTAENKNKNKTINKPQKQTNKNPQTHYLQELLQKRSCKAESLQEILKNIPEKEISSPVSDQNRHRICNSVFGNCQELQKEHSNTKPRLTKLAFKQTPWDLVMCRTQTIHEYMMIHYQGLKLML